MSDTINPAARPGERLGTGFEPMCRSLSISFEDDSLKAMFYDAMAQVAHAASEVKEKNISLPVRFWKLERNLREFIKSVNVRNPEFAPVNRATIDDTLEKFHSLHASIEKLLGSAKRNGLSNRALYGTQLNAIARHSDEILDIAETLELLLDPATRSSFDRAGVELKQGSTVGLKTLVQ